MSATQVSFAEFAAARIDRVAVVESTPSDAPALGHMQAGGLVAQSAGIGGECPLDRRRRRCALLRPRWERLPYGVLMHTPDGPVFTRFTNRARAWNSARVVRGLFVQV